jgi:putative acetyltransferase
MEMTKPIIRPMRPEDAVHWYESRIQPQVIWGTLQLPTINLEEVRNQTQPHPDVHKLVAEVDGKVVGSVVMRVGTGARRHTGSLGITVHDAYQGRGIGKALMAAILDLADNALMLERVELEVYTDNQRAIHLYRQFGFVDEGIVPRAARRDGQWADLLYMGRLTGRAAAQAQAVPAEAVPAEAAPAAATPAEAAPPRTGRSAPPADLRIRAYRPEDLKALYRIMSHPAVGPSLGRLPTFQEEELRKELTNLPRSHHLLVAETAGQVVGMAYMVQLQGRVGHTGQINALAVDPAWQGQSIGTALLQALVDLAARWLALRRLTAAVQAPDLPARALLTKFGFTTDAVRRAAFIRHGRFVDGHVMDLLLEA